jgi:hypothetical protein
MRFHSVRMAVGAAGLSLLAACGGGGGGPQDVRPSNVADLCAIYRDNPHWAEAATEAERRWGAPQEVKMAIIWRESTFRNDARPVKYLAGVPVGYASSAFGYAQAIDGTWEWYRKDTGAEGERDVFIDAIDFVGWYMAKTREMTGVPTWDAYNQYLAYHEGQNGFNRGSWRQKQWLQRAAAQVAHQAEVYRQQRRSCGMIAGVSPATGRADARSVAAATRPSSGAGSRG